MMLPLTFQPESSVALEWFQMWFSRITPHGNCSGTPEREFDMDVITTVPNVSYHVYDKKGTMKEVHNPGGLPDVTLIDSN